MTPERWRAVRAAFDRLATLGEKERELELAALEASDRELAHEARSLLAAEARDSGFLDAPAAGASIEADRRGERFGAWEILSRLGEGGMGEVFLARRADASFEKLAALKLVHADLLSPALRARFAAERQALAALEHPGIARLLDGGESASGQPFLVLEYVEGRQLLEHATEERLSTRQRIELFVQILSAVAHAHRHLVVHRDLKPSNILVTPAGEAKLLDFGVAKILAAPTAAGEGATETRTLLRALTPEYASPEQILGGATTTASDVYSLGVVLFELLTGRRPYRVPTGAPEEWAEAALHQEAARAPELSGDLEAIVRKALQKAPAERYSGADSFADDLRRYLEGRTIAARPASAADRALKFARRNKLGVGLGAAALLAVVVTALVALAQAAEARRERDRAAVEAETAQSVANFLGALFRNADPARTRGAKLTAREILDQGARRIEVDLEGQPVVQAKLLTVLGAVHRDLGLLDLAEPMLTKALALREAQQPADPVALAEALHELGSYYRLTNDLEKAQERLDRARELRERLLPPDHPDLARTLSALALVYRNGGDLDRARPLIERALAISQRSPVPGAEAGRWLNHLGLVHQDAGEYEKARVAYEDSLKLLEQSEGPENPLVAIPLDNLGQVLRTLGRPQEALPLHQRAEALVAKTWGTEHSQYGTALNSLGTTLVALERQAEAVELYERAAAVYAAAIGPESAYVAWPIRNQAEALLALGRPAEALPLFERALAIRRAAYGEAHPDTAQSLTDLGLGYAAIGELDAAERWLREGLTQSIAAFEPANLAVAEARIFLADLLVRRNETDEARALYLEALPSLRAAYSATDPRVVAVEKQLSAIPAATPPA